MNADRAQLLITAVDQTKSAFDSVRANLIKLGEESSRVKALLAGVGVSLSAVGFAAMIKGSIDSADQLNKLSQKIGVSVEALSTLRFAAQLSDVDLETLQKSLKGLSEKMTQAMSGVGEGARLLSALGVTLKNNAGQMQTTQAVLLQVANVFAQLEDGAVKSTLAVSLFGKQGLAMIPFLNQGAEGITRLTREAERLGLKLNTDTAQAAENFNDNVHALQAASGALGRTLARDLVPELTTITTVMRQAADETGTLKALWIGLGGVGNLVFNGTEIKQARDEVAKLTAQVTTLREHVQRGRAPIPFLPWDVQFDERSLATLQANLKKAEDALSAAKARLQSLTQTPLSPTPQGQPSEELQRTACALSGGHWVNGRCVSQDTHRAQLALVSADTQAELAIIKTGLSMQQAALESALADRLVAINDYYAQKTALDQQAIDHDRQLKQQELAAQQQALSSVTEETPRLHLLAAIKKLQGEITVLGMQRAAVDVANAHASTQAQKELADELSRVREQLSQLHGGDATQSLQAIQRQYQPLLDKLTRRKDTQGVAQLTQLIHVESDLAALALLERQYQNTLDAMSVREREFQQQRDTGQITELEQQRAVLDLHHQTAQEVETLIPKMQALASATGSPEAITRVARLRAEVEALSTQLSDLAKQLNTNMENDLATAFEAIGSGAKSAKDAFSDFARSVLQDINKIAAKHLAQSLFSGMNSGGEGGVGSLIGSAIAGGFAHGGFIQGPGTATSDSILARLSTGEFVMNAAAVRRIGVNVLHALNGGVTLPPRRGASVGFSGGGLVQSATPSPAPASQAVRIVNVIDPSLTSDYLNSPSGEKVVLNLLSRNTGTLKQLLTS